MLSADEITRSLPRLRDDEPTSLRQDIVDEILDHLQCGLRRELLVNGGDEIAAKQRVLDHFGDPVQVAKKLWYQAMWSKIMTQRLVVGSTILSMVVSVCLVVMMSIGIQQMSRQQQVNAALFEQMAKLNLQRVDSPPRDLRWNNLKIKLTKGSMDGPPAAGFEIRVRKLPAIGEVASNGSHFVAKMDDSGLSDCGHVEPGMFQVEIDTPWNEKAQVNFTVFPGIDHLEHVVVPEQMPEMTTVRFDHEAAFEELATQGTALVVTFVPTGEREIAGRSWKSVDWMAGMSRPKLLIVPQKGIWISYSTSNTPLFGPYNITQSISGAKWKKLSSSIECTLPANIYRVTFDIVTPGQNVMQGPNLPPVQNVTPDDPKWDAFINVGSMSYTTRPDMDWAHPVYVAAEIDKLNEWTIPIPDEVKKCLDGTVKLGGGFF